MKRNCVSEVIGLFGMFCCPVSVRQAVLILIWKSNEKAAQSHLLNVHPTDKVEESESVIEHLYRKLPAQHFSFCFPLRLVAAFSDCGDCKSLVFPSRSCGLDWDQEGGSDYSFPYPQAMCGIRKFANIPHPFLLSCNTTSSSWTVSQSVTQLQEHALPLGWMQYKGRAAQNLSWQITTFSWFSCSFPRNAVHRHSNTEKEEIERRRKRRHAIPIY